MNTNYLPADQIHDLNYLYNAAIRLLKKLIATPSYSGEENHTAEHIENFLAVHHIPSTRKNNNVWAYNKYYDPQKGTILLNSHHDTVKPNSQYTHNPFEAMVLDDKLYGLGSNDAGGALVSLLATFVYFYDEKNLPFNICIAATGEEENSGKNGIQSILSDLTNLSCAIVGEPTEMEIAVSEMGSMVVDFMAKGRSAHAAREEGDNAIYKAFKDINWLSSYHFPKCEGEPEPVKMTVTQIQAGTQHNVVPGDCSFTVDIRFNHEYHHREILNTLINHTSSLLKVRPTVSCPSQIGSLHPLVLAAKQTGRKTYHSPTGSDQAWIEVPSIKMGPGCSARSHTANEFIYIEEIESGISIYVRLIEALKEIYQDNDQTEAIHMNVQG